jgi:hypothetical protein
MQVSVDTTGREGASIIMQKYLRCLMPVSETVALGFRYAMKE